jgi:hypothetical protein
MSAEDDRDMTSTEPADGRDHAVEGAWRKASQEQPSADLDARILAAGCAAVGTEAGPRPLRREPTGRNVLQRWQPLLAAAAVAGLAFVLVPMTLSPPTTQRATAPATAPALESESPRATTDGVAEPVMQSELPVERPAAPTRPPAPALDPRASKALPAIPPPPPAASTTTSSAPAEPPSVDSSATDSESTSSFGAVTSTVPRHDAQRVERDGSRAESAADAAPAPQAREKRVVRSAPSELRAWVERIETAYRAGDLKTAAAELRAFRAVDPAADDYLPDELRDWARTVD